MKFRSADKKATDTLDQYSHHQYQPISVEFFERSLSSPASGMHAAREYNSDAEAIAKGKIVSKSETKKNI